ncbi:MAG: FtsQ-type POTRA domain-containing protein [Candidatus Caldatribacteriota bacterium]|nr:FtsQ-type POTRA domain-containing protein [Candidatus Caldatribacteriota bacterium]
MNIKLDDEDKERDVEGEEEKKVEVAEEELEKKSEKNQPLTVKLIKILIFYLAIGFLGWNFFAFIFSSNFCNIEEVIIKGNDCLSEDEILCSSKVKLGENIFKLDLKKSKDSLMQEPWIKEVEIKRVIPNKIIISIKERKPAAIIHIGEEYFSSTKEGIVLSKIDSPEEKFSLPLVLGLEINEIKIGEIIDKPEFRTALESTNSVEVILPKKFCRVEILSPDDFMICNKDDSLKVRVNGPEGIINKENLLREALEKIEREKLLVEYVDIRFKDSLVIKLKK